MSIMEHASSPPPILQMMFSDGTPKRASLTALVVGSILISINHGDFIVDGSKPAPRKIILTYCVPYCVTTWGAVTGKLAQWRRSAHPHS